MIDDVAKFAASVGLGTVLGTGYGINAQKTAVDNNYNHADNSISAYARNGLRNGVFGAGLGAGLYGAQDAAMKMAKAIIKS